MKIVCISDSHNLHHKLVLPEADMIIHCGDFTSRGRPEEVFNFLAWYSKLNYKYKILVCGNHELGLQEFFLFNAFREQCNKEGVFLLHHEDITLEGINIFGSPYTPEFCNWAFMYPEEKGKDIWDVVPDEINLLISHGPPMYILDGCKNGNVGCPHLRNKVDSLPNLKYHVFGHIHDNFGISGKFVNASSCTEQYKLRKVPYHVIEV